MVWKEYMSFEGYDAREVWKVPVKKLLVRVSKWVSNEKRLYFENNQQTGTRLLDSDGRSAVSIQGLLLAPCAFPHPVSILA